MDKIFYLLILMCSFFFQLEAQTVGAILNTSEASHQLTLLSPVPSRNSYLIDNCGHIYNQWTSDYKLGLSSKLDKDGNLYRGGLVSSPFFNAGGKGGVLEKYSWDGQLIWTIEMANDSLNLHHDFELLPDGNLLVVAWEYLSFDEIVALGRDSSITSPNGFYSEVVFEINPENNFQTEWVWRAIEHIVQDRDPGKPAFGLIKENPQRIDVNLNVPGNLSQPVDWLHINSVDYNPILDQILLSCNGIDEIIIIDHSTTIQQSSSSEGGLAEMGGDVLYRWGNTSNYLGDSLGTQLLFAQHDANWLFKDDQVEDRILLFNNGLRIDNINYSSVDEIQLKRTGAYNYMLNVDEPDKDIIWSYNKFADQGLYSKRMSGARRIDSERTIITESDYGRIFEIDKDGNIVWTYISPIDNTGVLSQGSIPQGNIVFKVESYSQAFFNDEVAPSTEFDKIEDDPIDNCEIFLSDVDDLTSYDNVFINQRGHMVDLFYASGKKMYVRDINGRLIDYKLISDDRYSFDMSEFTSGVYIISLSDKTTAFSSFKVILH